MRCWTPLERLQIASAVCFVFPSAKKIPPMRVNKHITRITPRLFMMNRNRKLQRATPHKQGVKRKRGETGGEPGNRGSWQCHHLSAATNQRVRLIEIGGSLPEWLRGLTGRVRNDRVMSCRWCRPHRNRAVTQPRKFQSTRESKERGERKKAT